MYIYIYQRKSAVYSVWGDRDHVTWVFLRQKARGRGGHFFVYTVTLTHLCFCGMNEIIMLKIIHWVYSIIARLHPLHLKIFNNVLYHNGVQKFCILSIHCTWILDWYNLRPPRRGWQLSHDDCHTWSHQDNLQKGWSGNKLLQSMFACLTALTYLQAQTFLV